MSSVVVAPPAVNPAKLPTGASGWPSAVRADWRTAQLACPMNFAMFELVQLLERVHKKLVDFGDFDAHHEMAMAWKNCGFGEIDYDSDETQWSIEPVEVLPQAAIGLAWCVESLLSQISGAICGEGEMKAKADQARKRRKA